MSTTSTRTEHQAVRPRNINPKDSMKSTWRFDDRRKWNNYHWGLEWLKAHHWHPEKPIPVHEKTDKMPYVPQLSIQAWILFHAAIPLVIHQAWVSLTGVPVHGVVVVVFYTVAFIAIVFRQLGEIRRLGHAYGFLDGDVHGRDGIPDVGVAKVLLSGPKTGGGRMLLAALLTYSASRPPADSLTSPAWLLWLPLQIGLYGIILDFWFYCYHRAMHDIGPLWKFHRTHHLTKHPVPTLAAYADEEQEFFDMVGIPFLAWLTLKMMGGGLALDFYSWWIAHQYIAFTEFGGHSGLRLHMQAASTLCWLLSALGMEIVTEDHDLHHRKGWRKSHNYGKQTRVWDTLFGTRHERIESSAANVDLSNPVYLTIF